MAKTLLEVEHLTKHFTLGGGFLGSKKRVVQAVNDVSFAIPEGSTFSLVGESGCGKSTTGRSILRLIEPTGGKVTFDGKVITDVEGNNNASTKEMMGLRRDMQMVFQDPYACLDPRMNIGSIVAEGIKKHKLASGSAAYDMAADMLKLCGMERDCLRRYPHEFSGGQRQRIGIARSLALHPKFIVADEPIAALDVSIQAQILNLLIDLQEEMKLTYLFISHDLGVVHRFCDHIGVMYLGCMMELGDTNAVYNNPQHPYTRALLSAIPTSNPEKRKARIRMEGEPPSPVNPPSGCRFHPRCPYATSVCREAAPELRPTSRGTMVACHRLGEI